MVLTKGEQIISNDVKVAETMMNFSLRFSDSLGIDENPNNENSSEGSSSKLLLFLLHSSVKWACHIDYLAGLFFLVFNMMSGLL